MLDPFEEVSPVAPIDPWQALTTELGRSMMWDMIGPTRMKDEPQKYGQQPASLDVLEAEAKEMYDRKHSMLPFGMDFSLLCYMAAESASLALIKNDEDMTALPDEDKLKFRIHNVKLGTAIAETVVSHMLQKGLIQYGDTNEFLGTEAEQ
jgi:hypothetical protein